MYFLHREMFSSGNISSNLLPEGSFKSGKMDSFAGSEPRNFIPSRLDEEKTGKPVQDSSNTTATPITTSTPNEQNTNPSSGGNTNPQSVPMDAESTQPQTPVDPPTLSRLLATECSGSGESCEAYLARKLQDMEEQTTLQPLGSTIENPRLQSTSEQIEITPKANAINWNLRSGLDEPRVTFLDDPKSASDGSRSPH